MLSPVFSSIADHRVTGRCTYDLSELLTIALLTCCQDPEPQWLRTRRLCSPQWLPA